MAAAAAVGSWSTGLCDCCSDCSSFYSLITKSTDHNKSAFGSWSTGLCDCFSDCTTCCLTIWCPCVAFGRIAEIVDKGTTSCCCHGTLYCMLGGFTHFMSIYACVYRTKMRRLYGIDGNQCGDCCVSLICPHISICQQYRELTYRGFDVPAGWDGNVRTNTRGVMEATVVQGGMSR